MELLKGLLLPLMFLGLIALVAMFLSLIVKGVLARTSSNPDECDVCGYDLRASPGRCPECGGEGRLRYARLRRLREDWPADAITPRTPEPDETLTVVYQTDDSMLATLLAEHLEVRGIPCHRADPKILGHTDAGAVYGSYHLAVWSADAAEAQTLIARLTADPTDPLHEAEAHA